MWKKWIFALTISLPAFGYNLTSDFVNGFYWASLPISITVIESNVSRKNALESLSRSAIGEWESRTGFSLWDFDQSNGSNPASSNIIRWSTNFAAETNMDPNSVLAVAIRYTSGPYIARTEIVINGSHFLNQNYSNLLTTVTHELGHTMGIDHSNVTSAVMAPTLQDPYRGLAQDDIQAMDEAHSTTEHRQLTGYISPLAYTKSEEKNPLSCGTIGPAGAASSSSAIASLGLGMLIGFVRKIIKWFKSLL